MHIVTAFKCIKKFSPPADTEFPCSSAFPCSGTIPRTTRILLIIPIWRVPPKQAIPTKTTDKTPPTFQTRAMLINPPLKDVYLMIVLHKGLNREFQTGWDLWNDGRNMVTRNTGRPTNQSPTDHHCVCIYRVDRFPPRWIRFTLGCSQPIQTKHKAHDRSPLHIGEASIHASILKYEHR